MISYEDQVAAPMTRTPSVRRFLAEEWRTYKALRLGALADSPDAFGATLAGERIRSDAEWADRLGSGMDERWNLPLLAEIQSIGLADRVPVRTREEFVVAGNRQLRRVLAKIGDAADSERLRAARCHCWPFIRRRPGTA